MLSGTSAKPFYASNLVVYLLAAIIIWAPIPLASNRIWAWSILHVLIAITAVVHCVLAYRARQPWVQAPWVSRFLAVPLALALYMFLQYSPLVPWLATASPFHTTLLLERTLYLSLYLWLLLVNLTTVARLKIFVVAIVASGFIQAAYGAMLHLSGLSLSPVFGLPEGERARGSFVYQNHYANYLALCISMAIGWIISELQISGSSQGVKAKLRNAAALVLSSKMLLRMAVVVMIIGLILSRSRMGNSGFFVALGITALIAVFFYRQPPRFLKPLVVSIFILDLVIIGAIFGVEKVKQRIEDTSFGSETRDEVVLHSLPIIEQHWLTGTGAGSFYTVFPAYQQIPYSGFYDHAHNEYVQFAVEFGVPVTLLLGAWQLYALWLCLQTMRRRRTRFYQGLAFGAMMANLHMLVHNTVDFNLQAPANTLLFVSILAISHLVYYNDSKPKRLRRQLTE